MARSARSDAQEAQRVGRSVCSSVATLRVHDLRAVPARSKREELQLHLYGGGLGIREKAVVRGRLMPDGVVLENQLLRKRMNANGVDHE